MKRQVPFQPATSWKSAVQSSMTKLLAEKQRALTESIMSPHNTLHYSHGMKWKHPANPDDEDGTMESHSAEISLPFVRIIDGDISLLLESIDGMSEEFHRQLMQSMYSLISRTCDKTGNVVKASQNSFPEAFEEMLEKIEFSVDRNGDVSLPQLHTGDAKGMTQALQAQPPEYHERIQRLIDRKSAEAREQEALRRAKFREKRE